MVQLFGKIANALQDKFFLLFYQVVYFFLYHVGLVLVSTTEYIRAMFLFFLNRSNDIVSNHQKIYSHIHGLKQRPNHLTVILNLEAPSTKHMARIVVWALNSNIEFISFFDHKNQLPSCFKELQYRVETLKDNDDEVIWDNDTSLNVNQEQQRSGPDGSGKRRIYAKIMGLEDGKPAIAKLCRQLISTAIAEGNTKPITTETIDNGLKAMFRFSDPDLALVCGAPYSISHYPPWQIRTTEIIPIHSHRTLTLTEFHKLLIEYNNVEQRFGK